MFHTKLPYPYGGRPPPALRLPNIHNLKSGETYEKSY